MLAFYDDTPGNAVADLLAIAVSADARAQGLGRKLLEFACDRAAHSGAQSMVLAVAGENRIAMSLFASAGFEQVPGDHGYYDGGQRTLKMRLVLG